MAAPFARLALAGLITLFPALSTAAAPADKKADSPAVAQLETARQTKRKANGKDGDEKRKILEESIGEYRKVLDQFGEEAGACAEASFRIGEIERSLGDVADARAAFETTLRYGGAAPRFAARALNEIAHLSRRTGEAEAAIAGYQRVLKEYPAEESEAVKALTWIGKVEESRGNHEQARETWLSIADRYPSQPVQAIRAADLAALCAIDAGDAAAAREIVERTRTRFAAENEDQAWWSPAVEESLQKMKAPARLAIEG